MIKNNDEAYKNISEVAELLNLVNSKTGKISTHTLRFWEKEFKQVKPKIFAGKRRYYDAKTIEVATTVPDMTLMAPANTRMVYNIPSGITFSTAISIAGCNAGGTGSTVDPGSAIPVRITCK